MVVGITGGFCTGKSKVADIFKKLGAKIIDLDKLAHTTLRPNTKSFKEIINEFGKDILVNNRINRLLLAQKVFGNRKKLVKLNSIIHPIVIKKMVNLTKRFSKKHRIIVIEVPLLFEAGIKNYFDYIVVVKTDKETQVNRAIRKTGLERNDVLKRINSQWSIFKKIKQADFVVDNNSSVEKTRKQTKKIWQELNMVF